MIQSFFINLPPVWLHSLIIGAWVISIMGFAVTLHHYTSIDSEIIRKIAHIGVGNLILIAWILDISIWIGVIASIIASVMALISYKLPILPGINSVGRQSLGTFFYAVSIGVLIAWFWYLHQPHYAAIGVLIMTWGDGFAALIGQRFGKHSYTVWGMLKSWEGSLTMALVSFTVTLLILLSVQGNLWQSWIMAIAAAIVATGLEAFSKFGIDNLTVPIGSAALVFMLHQLLFFN